MFKFKKMICAVMVVLTLTSFGAICASGLAFIDAFTSTKILSYNATALFEKGWKTSGQFGTKAGKPVKQSYVRLQCGNGEYDSGRVYDVAWKTNMRRAYKSKSATGLGGTRKAYWGFIQ